MIHLSVSKLHSKRRALGLDLTILIKRDEDLKVSEVVLITTCKKQKHIVGRILISSSTSRWGNRNIKTLYRKSNFCTFCIEGISAINDDRLFYLVRVFCIAHATLVEKTVSSHFCAFFLRLDCNQPCSTIKNRWELEIRKRTGRRKISTFGYKWFTWARGVLGAVVLLS